MIIWRTVPVVINHKTWHIHKVGKRPHRGFTGDYGDVPCWRINEITGQREAVVNNRGNAYGARKRKMYRNKTARPKINYGDYE